jgi:twitching motility two-component system response regulator PilH
MSKKILVVDDSPVELANLRMLLHDHGYHTVTATTGRECVEKAIAEMPSLILLDIIMPDMDGYEACRRLRSDAKTKPIPVVFVSSKNQKADQLWATMQGAKALIGKPYTPEQILQTVRAFA